MTNNKKIASFWSTFAATGNNSLPTLTQILKFKEMGFTGVAIAEIRYGEQATNFKNIINSLNGYTPQSNPIKESVDLIKAQGLEVTFILNPNRFGGVGGLLARPQDKQNFVNALKYLNTLNSIDYIEFEELTLFWDYALNPVNNQWEPRPVKEHYDQVTTFLKECRTLTTKKIGFNIPNNYVASMQAIGINPIDLLQTINFVKSQPGKDGPPNYLVTNERLTNVFNTYKNIYPGIEVFLYLYQNYSIPGPNNASMVNPNLISNINHMMVNNFNFSLFPAEALTQVQQEQLKAIMATSAPPAPTPQPNLNQGKISINASVKGATIQIKNNSTNEIGNYGKTPRPDITAAAPDNQPITIEPGRHTLILSLNGYNPYLKDFSISAGEHIVFDNILLEQQQTQKSGPTIFIMLCAIFIIFLRKK